MKRAWAFLPAALLLAACARERSAVFEVGLLGEPGPRVRVEAARLGVPIAAGAPAGADAQVSAGADGRTLPAARLRFLVSAAAAGGRTGVYFRPPVFEGGRDWLDYPEEWQAFSRAAALAVALKPTLEKSAGAALEVPEGLTARAWTNGGRRLLVLVNDTAVPAVVPEELLEGRALFAPRVEPREALEACGGRLCLAPGRDLWIEGR